MAFRYLESLNMCYPMEYFFTVLSKFPWSQALFGPELFEMTEQMHMTLLRTKPSSNEST